MSRSWVRVGAVASSAVVSLSCLGGSAAASPTRAVQPSAPGLTSAQALRSQYAAIAAACLTNIRDGVVVRESRRDPDNLDSRSWSVQSWAPWQGRYKSVYRLSVPDFGVEPSQESGTRVVIYSGRRSWGYMSVPDRWTAAAWRYLGRPPTTAQLTVAPRKAAPLPPGEYDTTSTFTICPKTDEAYRFVSLVPLESAVDWARAGVQATPSGSTWTLPFLEGEIVRTLAVSPDGHVLSSTRAPVTPNVDDPPQLTSLTYQRVTIKVPAKSRTVPASARFGRIRADLRRPRQFTRMLSYRVHFTGAQTHASSSVADAQRIAAKAVKFARIYEGMRVSVTNTRTGANVTVPRRYARDVVIRFVYRDGTVTWSQRR